MSERECCQKCREAAELRNERAWFSRTMLVCHRCGNKRCPKIVDHRHACTNSNEPGQVGAPGVDAVIPPPVEYRTVPATTIATLTHRAEAAERELAEIHRGVESTALHDARVARDAANDAASLWRERCNKAEARVEALTAELRRLYAAVCHGQTRSDDARAIAQAVIDEYVQTAEQCDRNDTLRERMEQSRSLWEVAEHRAERDWLRTERDAWKRVADERMANYDAAVRDGAALLAKLARAEGVVGHMRDLAEHECTYRDGCPTFGSRHGQCTGCKAREALATYEEG
jgi:hypothetical protein